MIIEKFYADQFRNLKEVEISPCEGVNIIFGENGQGKTNIIEGIWMFTGFKSFRTKKNNELIMHNKEYYNLSLDFFADNRQQNFQIKGNKDFQEVYKNKVKAVSNRSMIGDFFAVVFSPSHLNLIKGGPDEKRRFIDIAISQTDSSYARSLSEYYKILRQRNALLKNYDKNNINVEFLEVWDESLSKSGALIIKKRKDYLEKLKVFATERYAGISENKEELSVDYVRYGSETAESIKENAEILLEELKNSRELDIRRKYTSKGPHRDDVEILLDKKNIRSFGSQGQQRSAALSLKLAEATIIYEIRQEKPVALLDDVMSELDISRQNYILNELKDWQVFITCCEPTQVIRMKSGKSFEIGNGKLLKG